MNRDKIKYVTKVITAIGVISMVMAIFGHGCGNLKSSNSTLSSLGAASCAANGFERIAVTPGQSTISLIYGDTVLTHYATCTGVGNDLSQKTKDEYMARANAFSEYGSALDITAPMLMGSLAVAGEVCDDLVDKERNLASQNRVVFTHAGWGNFTGTSCPSDAAVDETIANMAFSCWSVRPEDLPITGAVSVTEAVQLAFPQEMGVIKGGLSRVGSNQRACAITLCSAMLASLRGLLANN